MIMKGAVAHETTVHTYVYLLLMTLVQTEIRTAKAVMPEPSAFEVEMAIEKPKMHKSRGIDQIPVHLIKAGDVTIRSEIHKIIYSISNEEELHEEWKDSIIVPIYQKGDKTDCSNYRDIPHTIHKILSSILLLSRLTPYVEKIIGDRQRGI
jgi:hypothetical protein